MKRFGVMLMFLLLGAITLSSQPNLPTSGVDQGYQKKVLNYIVEPNSVVFSKTFSEWDAEWQQWAFSIPVSKHPLFDGQAPRDCSVGQSGPVWFLGGRFCGIDQPGCDVTNVQRSCTVPYGKMLYFPVANGEDSSLEQQCVNPGLVDNQQIGFLRAEQDFFTNPPTSDYAIIDGVSVPHLERYAVQSVAFGFILPEDNYLKDLYSPTCSFPAGNYFPGIDSGHYLMLAPLAPGPHVIKFGAYVAANDWGFNVTYHLNVVK